MFSVRDKVGKRFLLQAYLGLASSAMQVQAERAAWDFCNQKGIDLVTICPTYILGPVTSNRIDAQSVKNFIVSACHPCSNRVNCSSCICSKNLPLLHGTRPLPGHTRCPFFLEHAWLSHAFYGDRMAFSACCWCCHDQPMGLPCLYPTLT